MEKQKTVGKCCENPIIMWNGAWCSACGTTAGQGEPNVRIKRTLYWNYEEFQKGVRTYIFQCKKCGFVFSAKQYERIRKACQCSNVLGRFTSDVIKIIDC